MIILSYLLVSCSLLLLCLTTTCRLWPQVGESCTEDNNDICSVKNEIITRYLICPIKNQPRRTKEVKISSILVMIIPYYHTPLKLPFPIRLMYMICLCSEGVVTTKSRHPCLGSAISSEQWRGSSHQCSSKTSKTQS